MYLVKYPTRSGFLVAAAVLVMGLLFSYTNALAASRTIANVQQLAKGSELAFVGRVVDITYVTKTIKSSEEKPVEIPFSFVTYEIENVLRGSTAAKSKTLTLRFTGGLRKSDGAVLWLSNSPRIDVGDRDLLFVRANQIADNPLTDHLNGRLRIIKDRLYSEEGHALILQKSGNLQLGKKFDHPEVLSHKLGESVYEVKRDKDDDPKEPASKGQEKVPEQATSMTRFMNAYKKLAPKESPELRPVSSADPKADFEYALGQAAKPFKE